VILFSEQNKDKLGGEGCLSNKKIGATPFFFFFFSFFVFSFFS